MDQHREKMHDVRISDPELIRGAVATEHEILCHPVPSAVYGR
jgi:hypothetical protein